MPRAAALRQTNPDKIAYVRVATTDTIQGAAGADIAYNVVGAKTAYVLDDTQTYGKGLADVFAADFAQLGGTVVGPRRRAGHDHRLHQLRDQDRGPEARVRRTTAASPPSGLGLFRKQMDQQGLSNIPFGGGDGINDGSAATASSFLNIAGPTATRTPTARSRPSTTSPTRPSSRADYKAQFNAEPGAYSAPAYACTQVILQALQAAGGVSDMATLREDVRAYIATTTNSYQTVLGAIQFDANGDTSQHTISYYKFDADEQGLAVLQAARLHRPTRSSRAAQPVRVAVARTDPPGIGDQGRGVHRGRPGLLTSDAWRGAAAMSR